MKFTSIRRIIKEDFPSKDRELVGKMAQPINNMFQFQATVFNNGITFSDNINCQIKDIDITVDATGKPTSAVVFKSTLKTSSQGILVIKATNLTNSDIYPTGAPFVSSSENNSQITINNVTGLQAGQKYTLRIISIA
jgi:acetaldehyde dehydrogenase (acetylating)